MEQENTIFKIGCYLSKEFIKIKDFDMDANLTNFNELFDYFSSLCENLPEKKITLHLVSLIILNTNELSEEYQYLINNVMKIILTDNFLKNKENVNSLMNKLLNEDLKKCLKKDQILFIDLCKQFCGISIIELFELMTYFFSSNSEEDLLNYCLRNFFRLRTISIILHLLPPKYCFSIMFLLPMLLIFESHSFSILVVKDRS